MSARYPPFPLQDDALRDELLARYAEPHRAYHNLAHLLAVLAAVDDLIAAGEPVDDVVAVQLAAWFHDAVYDPRAGDNEEASARLAETRLASAGVDRGRVAQVVALVRATADHRVDGPDAAVLMDADLAVLAREPSDYERYVAAVRREYAHLHDDDWRTGRVAVVQGLLDRKPIYATATMRAHEARARTNLAGELVHLGSYGTATTPVGRWQEGLAAWAIPDEIIAAAPRSPWGFDVSTFECAADEARGRNTPSRRRALEALPPGGSVLDVGCGAGAAAYALVPPAGRVIGVDSSVEMLQAFAARGDTLGVDHSEIAGGWPEIAERAPTADVVVCHHVVHNVADLPAFARALHEHARRRVVLEMTVTHPLAWTAPLWQRFHGLPRQPGPTVDDAVAVLHTIGLAPHVERWEGTSPWGQLDRAVATARRRLCLPRSRDDEIRAALLEGGLPSRRHVATLYWSGDAEARTSRRG